MFSLVLASLSTPISHAIQNVIQKDDKALVDEVRKKYETDHRIQIVNKEDYQRWSHADRQIYKSWKDFPYWNKKLIIYS